MTSKVILKYRELFIFSSEFEINLFIIFMKMLYNRNTLSIYLLTRLKNNDKLLLDIDAINYDEYLILYRESILSIINITIESRVDFFELNKSILLDRNLQEKLTKYYKYDYERSIGSTVGRTFVNIQNDLLCYFERKFFRNHFIHEY